MRGDSSVRRVGLRAARGSAKTGSFESLALRASCGVVAEKRRTQRAWRCARKSASFDASSRRRHAPSEDRVGGRDAPRRAPVRGFHVYAVESIRGVLVRGPPLAHHRRPEARARGAKNADFRRSVPRKFPRHLAKRDGGVTVLPRQTRSLRHLRFGTSTRAACPRNAARRDHEPRDARSKPRRRGDRRAPARCRAPRVRRDCAPGGWPRLQSLARVGSPRHAVRGVRVRGGQDRQRAGRHPRRLAGRARARRGTPARLRVPAPHSPRSLSRASTHPRRAALVFSSVARGNARLLSLRAYTRSPLLGLTPLASIASIASPSRTHTRRNPSRRRRRGSASPAR